MSRRRSTMTALDSLAEEPPDDGSVSSQLIRATHSDWMYSLDVDTSFKPTVEECGGGDPMKLDIQTEKEKQKIAVIQRVRMLQVADKVERKHRLAAKYAALWRRKVLGRPRFRIIGKDKTWGVLDDVLKSVEEAYGSAMTAMSNAVKENAILYQKLVDDKTQADNELLITKRTLERFRKGSKEAQSYLEQIMFEERKRFQRMMMEKNMDGENEREGRDSLEDAAALESMSKDGIKKPETVALEGFKHKLDDQMFTLGREVNRAIDIVDKELDNMEDKERRKEQEVSVYRSWVQQLKAELSNITASRDNAKKEITVLMQQIKLLGLQLDRRKDIMSEQRSAFYKELLMLKEKIFKQNQLLHRTEHILREQAKISQSMRDSNNEDALQGVMMNQSQRAADEVREEILRQTHSFRVDNAKLEQTVDVEAMVQSRVKKELSLCRDELEESLKDEIGRKLRKQYVDREEKYVQSVMEEYHKKMTELRSTENAAKRETERYYKKWILGKGLSRTKALMLQQGAISALKEQYEARIRVLQAASADSGVERIIEDLRAEHENKMVAVESEMAELRKTYDKQERDRKLLVLEHNRTLAETKKDHEKFIEKLKEKHADDIKAALAAERLKNVRKSITSAMMPGGGGGGGMPEGITPEMMETLANMSPDGAGPGAEGAGEPLEGCTCNCHSKRRSSLVSNAPSGGPGPDPGANPRRDSTISVDPSESSGPVWNTVGASGAVMGLAVKVETAEVETMTDEEFVSRAELADAKRKFSKWEDSNEAAAKYIRDLEEEATMKAFYIQALQDQISGTHDEFEEKMKVVEEKKIELEMEVKMVRKTIEAYKEDLALPSEEYDPEKAWKDIHTDVGLVTQLVDSMTAEKLQSQEDVEQAEYDYKAMRVETEAARRRAVRLSVKALDTGMAASALAAADASNVAKVHKTTIASDISTLLHPELSDPNVKPAPSLLSNNSTSRITRPSSAPAIRGLTRDIHHKQSNSEYIKTTLESLPVHERLHVRGVLTADRKEKEAGMTQFIAKRKLEDRLKQVHRLDPTAKSFTISDSTIEMMHMATHRGGFQTSKTLDTVLSDHTNKTRRKRAPLADTKLPVHRIPTQFAARVEGKKVMEGSKALNKSSEGAFKSIDRPVTEVASEGSTNMSPQPWKQTSPSTPLDTSHDIMSSLDVPVGPIKEISGDDIMKKYGKKRAKGKK